MRVTRRQFVAGSAAAAASMALSSRRVLGANDAINVGFIGVGSRGSHSAKWFSEIAGVRVAALADPDSDTLGKAAKGFPGAKTFQDLRKIIDDKSIDAVVISTCNHWHALAAIWACQAGKDVYVEKPISQTIWEGRKMVEAARKYNRIVQGGVQQRSDPCQAEIKAFIKSGKLGKMLWIRGNRFGVRESIGKLDQPLVPPATCDYNLWLGPAQDEKLYRKQFHYDWHWYWNTGSGEMGNWGVHILDDIRNMLFDQVTHPTRILSGGGRVAWNDAGQTPNMHFVYFDTPVVPVIFSLSNVSLSPDRKTAAPNYRSIQSGYVIQFEDGYYAGGRNGGWAYDNDGKRLQQFKGDGGGAHAKNFIDAVRNRDPKMLAADVELAHYSSAWCHLANIAFRLGREYSKDQALAAYKDFKPWNEMMEGWFHKQLADNQIDWQEAGLKLSSVLEFDPKKEVFVGASATPAAQALLTREYRKGFEITDKI